jgi:hypothetical protein
MRPEARQRRLYWVAELTKLSGSFGDDSAKLTKELRAEIEKNGVDAPAAEKGLRKVLESVSLLHPSKNAIDYWTGINRSLMSSLEDAGDLWTSEKTASLEALGVVRDESLRYLRSERRRLLALSHQEALDELIRLTGLDSRISHVKGVEHGELLGV